MKTPARAGKRAPSSEALRQQAQDWLRTLVSGDVKPWDAEAFKRWLHASPAHKDAFYEVKRQWEELKPGIGEMLRSNPRAAAFHEQTLRGKRPGRRIFLGVAASAVAAAGVAIVCPPLGAWPPPSEWNADYRTATGEQRTLAMADSINVTLNTQTSIRRHTAGSRTVGLELITGEAAVDLKDAAEMFTVAAGPGRSTAGSGRFEVRYLEGRVCVTCIAGAVRVQHPAGERMLQARQQTMYDAASISGVAGIDPADVSAWRKGELVFRQARLSDVLDEINRYRAGRVILLKPAVRNRPVSGRFAIAWLDAALLQLQNTFDLNARSLPGGVLVLS